MQMNNKTLRYLLCDTEEELDRSHVYTMPPDIEDLFESTRSSLSITDDMHRLSTLRLVQEVRRNIQDITSSYEYETTTSAHHMANNITRMLENYYTMGALQDFRLEDIQEDFETQGLRFNLVIQPTQSIERIHMSVQLNL